MKIEEKTLNNGLKVILVDTKAFPTLTVLLLVGAGSRYENKDNNGIAHFFEHMAFKGSKKYPNTFLISSTIEGIGGVFNAFTSKDHTGYWIKATEEHFETLIDVLADMVKNPLLAEEEIEREKGVIIEEINLYEDTPYRRVGDYFERLLYNNNPLGFDIAGSKKTVQSFNRHTFIDYIKNLYHPKNAVLVVAGGLPGLNQKKDYFKIIEEKFSSWKNGKKAIFERVRENQNKPQMFIYHKKTEQAHFCLGFRAFGFFDKRKYALKILSAILGGGMSSSLFIQVRERRGLCYYISTSDEQYADCGNIVTQAGVTLDKEKINEAIKVILEEHRKITLGKIKDDDLSRAKELIKGRFLLSLEDSFNVANFFGRRKLLEEKILRPEEVVEKIDRVTKDDLTFLAKEIFTPQRLNFALIGPFDKEDFVKAVRM